MVCTHRYKSMSLALIVRISNTGILWIQWDWYLVDCHSHRWIITSSSSVTPCLSTNIVCGWIFFLFLLISQILIIISSRFVPSTWYRSTRHDQEKGIKKHEMPRSTPHVHRTRSGKPSRHEHEHCEFESTTNVEEVWFAGCHCGTQKFN